MPRPTQLPLHLWLNCTDFTAGGSKMNQPGSLQPGSLQPGSLQPGSLHKPSHNRRAQKTATQKAQAISAAVWSGDNPAFWGAVSASTWEEVKDIS